MGINLGQTPMKAVYLGQTAVKSVFIGSQQVWSGEQPAPTAEPLCFTATQANSTVHLDKNGSPDAISLETSTDGSTWTDYSWSGSTGDTLTLANVGDKVYMRAKTENQTFSKDLNNYYKFVMSGQISASGNIQTLLKADGSRTDAPACCYYRLFNNCTSLTTAPELPATTLAGQCYRMMFSSCSSLTTAPALQATTLAQECYWDMFQYCTSLTSAPSLPATTLAVGCYWNMFYGCSSLSSMEVAFTTWNTTNATTNWVDGVAASGTFTCPAELSDIHDTSHIPTDWTVVKPEPVYGPGIWIVKTDGTTLSATANQIGKTNFKLGTNSYIINTLGISSPKTEISAFIDTYEPGDGITSLAQKAFEDTKSIEKVVLPSVTSGTGNYTFTVNATTIDHVDPALFKLREIHCPSLTSTTTFTFVGREPNLEVFTADFKSTYDDSVVAQCINLDKVWTDNEVFTTIDDGSSNLSSIIVQRSTGKAVVAAQKNRTFVHSTEVSALGAYLYAYPIELSGYQDYQPKLVSADFPNAGQIGWQPFESQMNLKWVHLPNATYFKDRDVFLNCGFLAGEFVLDFRGRTLNTVPTLATSGTNAFKGCPAGYQIVVPDSLYTAWTTASNWSVVANHIIRASDYEAQLGS